MRTTYLYRLRLTSNQVSVVENWLELLRKQYNYRLSERFRWFEENRCYVNSCPLVCHLPELKENPNFYSQKRDLLNTKKLFPEYKKVHSQVLQNCIERVDKTFSRYQKGDSSGKRSGKPRYKSVGRYRSFTYPSFKQKDIQGNRIKLPKIGWVKFVNHRSIPEGYKIKTVSVVKSNSKFYLTLCLEDLSVPTLTPDTPTLDNILGIDLGLNDFLVTSDGENEPTPKLFRKSEEKLKKLQRRVSRKKKGSNRRKKCVRRLAKQHNKIRNQRKDFHFKVSKKLLSKGKHVCYEKLNVKGMSKSNLGKSIHDAGWSSFIEILKHKAESAGVLTIPLNPKGTSIDCSNCGHKVKKTLQDRLHSCPSCKVVLNRDHNAAINIKYRAVGHHVLKAQDMSEALAGFTEKPTLYLKRLV